MILGLNLGRVRYVIGMIALSIIYPLTSLASVSISVTDLTSGISLIGGSGSQTGYTVADGGDFNGDGYHELLVTAPLANTLTGVVYIIDGTTDLSTPDVNLPTVATVVLSGAAAHDELGSSVAGGGDINGDDCDDIVIGAPGYDSNRGATYILYGCQDYYDTDSSTTYTITDMTDAGLGVELTGEHSGDALGYSVAIGNMNGGSADIAIGATGYAGVGAVYTVQGSDGLTSGIITPTIGQTARVDAETSASYPSASLGSSVVFGDVDGSGDDDVIIADDNANDDTGRVYVVYDDAKLLRGTRATATEALPLDTGIRLQGGTANERAGESLALGDTNGDGIDDLIVGASGYGGAGAAYIINGSTASMVGGLLSARSTAILTGELSGDRAGFSVAASDINADHFADVLIGADHVDAGVTHSGQFSVFLSSAAGFSDRSVSTADVQFNGVTANAAVGTSMAVVQRATSTFPILFTGAPGVNVSTGSKNGAVYGLSVYVDADADGVAGSAGHLVQTDCNDTDSTVTEMVTYYADSDGDGLGDVSTTETVCSTVAPTGFVANQTDRNDTDFDNDGVNTAVDCDDADSLASEIIIVYRDHDHDGLGDPNGATRSVCGSAAIPTGYVDNSDDLDDYDMDHDGLSAINDCDDTDPTVTTSPVQYFPDEDGDGLGHAESDTSIITCDPGSVINYVPNNDDVNDADYDNDGSSTDADCDDVDASVSEETTYYTDADGDGLGDSQNPVIVCSATPPTGAVADQSDVDDADPLNGQVITTPTPVTTTQTPVIASTITGVTPAAHGAVVLTYDDGSTTTVSIFPKYTGTVHTVVRYLPQRNIYLVAHPTGKALAVIQISAAGSDIIVLDRLRLTKHFSATAVRLHMMKGKVGRKQVLAVQLNNSKKQRSAIALIKLNAIGQDNVLLKKTTYKLQAGELQLLKKTPRLKQNKQSASAVITIRLQHHRTTTALLHPKTWTLQ